MKRAVLSIRYCLLLMLGILMCKVVFAQPFTYQGMLREREVPANRTYDFQFSLWTAPIGGAQVGPTLTRPSVRVVNGLFTVELDFGNVWNGSDRYLQIAVRPAGSGPYTVLSPRVKVSRAPYSHLATRALGVPWSGITGIPDGFADGIDNDTLYFAGAGLQLSGNVFSIANGGVTTSMIADGAVTSAKLATGAVNTTHIGDAQVTDAKIASVSWGKITGAPDSFPPGGSAGGDLSGTYPNPTVVRLQGRAVSSAAPGIGQVLKWDGSAWAPAVDQSGGDLWRQSGSNIYYDTGSVGIGVASPTSRLHVAANSSTTAATLRLHETEADSARLEFTNTNTTRRWQIAGFVGSTTTDDRVEFWNSTAGNVLTVRGDGTVAVRVLEVTGADLAERFPTSEEVEPGMVVEIDPSRPGYLRKAKEAYSKRVVGVVSGARGVSHGVVLANNGEGGLQVPVAMSGRVWVYADATQRAIEPGDFLTSAELPGYAMAVTDLAKAQGAILGKAMTPLEKGKRGMVLMIVNLQ